MSNKHGIFISYKRDNKYLAGRIYDYFYYRGLNPFMDEHSMNSVADFWKTIVEEIKDSLYFLLLLTKESFQELKEPDGDNINYYKEEILTAIKEKKKILILCFAFNPSLTELGKEFEYIHNNNYYSIQDSNKFFNVELDQVLKNDIDKKLAIEQLDWKNYSKFKANTLIDFRKSLEKSTATLEHRFGEEFVKAVKEKREPPADSYIVKEVNLVCYAGSLLFAAEKSMVDHEAYDYGLMYYIFGELFKNEDFHLTMVMNAPFSKASADAIKYGKLGNDALKDDEEAIFYLAYGRIDALREKEPYKTAFNNHQFLFSVTECNLPYALFEIVYDDAHKEYDHIKVDLYSYDIKSSVNRRSMIIFKDTDKDNYDFFKKQIDYFKSLHSESCDLIKMNHKKWVKAWKKHDATFKNKNN